MFLNQFCFYCERDYFLPYQEGQPLSQPLKDFKSFPVMFYCIISTTYHKIRNLFCHGIFVDFRTVGKMDENESKNATSKSLLSLLCVHCIPIISKLKFHLLFVTYWEGHCILLFLSQSNLLSTCTGILGIFDILQFQISSLMN